MPLPDALKSLVTTRRFWTDFLWETESSSRSEETPYPELEDCEVHLPVAGGYGLRLSLDEYLAGFTLDLTTPDRGAVNVAWDDQAHWHPHVLRWAELETICRVVAMQDAELPHPGYAVLLLHRFAPICQGDDLNSVVATLEAAWRSLGLFSDKEITTWIERIDARDAGFRWRLHEPQGWCIEQVEDIDSSRGLYSLRSAESEEFPFADWNRVVESAEATLGSAPGSLLTEYAPPACLPRQQHWLDLTIPHQDDGRPVPTQFGKLFNDTLDRILRGLNLGGSDCSGGSSVRNEDGTYTETESRYSVRVKGDLDEGLRILRGLLWWAKAPELVRLVGSGYRYEVLLRLGEPPAEPAPLVLQLGRLTTFRWRTGYRLDRVPLAEEHRQRLRELYSLWHAQGPDEDGWFRMDAEDGGRLSLCANHLDDDPDLDGITLAIERLTPGTASLVHQLMSKAEMMLLPPVLAPNAAVASQVSAPWPTVQVVESPSDLHAILADGAYAWWAASG